MIIIPAIDIRAGKCVRLTQGDYAQEKVYDDDPVAVAQGFEAEGAELIHVVDLDGAKAGEPRNKAIIERIVRAVRIPIEVGGGIRSFDSASALLDIGVSRVVVGTALVQRPDLAERLFLTFRERVVAGIDARGGKVAIGAWTEQSEVTAVDLALTMQRSGARRVILTDIARDGMLNGPNLELLEEVASQLVIPVIQSGGIGSLDHLRSLKGTRAEGVIVGRAIYEGKFSVSEAITAVSGA